MATANAIPFPIPNPKPDRPVKSDVPKAQAPGSPRAPEPGNRAPSPDVRQAQQATFRPWQQDVLELLACGSSVAHAMDLVHLAETTFYKTCNRHPAFKQAVDQARALYSASVEDAFHEADAYARLLVDRIQRDENVKVHLRLRAALAILNRKPGKWLPHAVPSPANVPEFCLDEAPERSPEAENQPSEARPSQPPVEQNASGDPKTLDTLDTATTESDLEELLEDQILTEELDALYRSLLPAKTLDTLDRLDTESTRADLPATSDWQPETEPKAAAQSSPGFGIEQAKNLSASPACNCRESNASPAQSPAYRNSSD